MKIRYKKKAKIFDIGIAFVVGIISVATMIYGVFHFGLKGSWPELTLNVFYLASLAMILLYFSNRINSIQFNYWCSISVLDPL